MKFFLPSVLFLFAQIISSASENWPRFRGNNGDGRADFTIPPVWKNLITDGLSTWRKKDMVPLQSGKTVFS